MKLYYGRIICKTVVLHRGAWDKTWLCWFSLVIWEADGIEGRVAEQQATAKREKVVNENVSPNYRARRQLEVVKRKALVVGELLLKTLMFRALLGSQASNVVGTQDKNGQPRQRFSALHPHEYRDDGVISQEETRTS